MTEAVTELIVRGDGALAVLDRFEDKMQAAGAATDVTTGAVADFERRMATARAQIEKGNAVTTQSIERKSAEQRAWERWSATVDKASALRIRLEREAQLAAVSAANAVNLGYTTQDKALATLIGLERRHAEQLRAVTDAQQSATLASVNAAQVNDELALSANRLAVANDNARGATANVAAQFQDIAVTAAMGMNPLMIALQQGTQLSSVLSTMQNPLKGLAGAFLSLLNPVTLLTIGFVTLAAVAVQWFSGASREADTATAALDRHRTALDAVVEGYGAAERAVGDFFAALERLPAQIAIDQLNMQFTEIGAEMDAVRERAAYLGTLFVGFGSAAEQSLSVLSRKFAAGEISATEFYLGLQDVRQEMNWLERAMSAVSVGKFISEMEQGAQKAMAFGDAINNLVAQSHALAGLSVDPTLEYFLSKNSLDGALSSLKQLTPELRSQEQIIRDIYAEAMAKPGLTDAGRTALGDARDQALSATATMNARRSGGGSATTNPYADLIAGSQEYISSKQLEAEALLMTTDAAARMRNEQDMLNRAANDNIALSPAQRDEISALADAMSKADMALAGAQMRLENRSPWEVAAAELANLDAMVRAGAISWDEYGAAATRSMAGAASDTLGSLGQITGALASAFEGNKAFAVANAVINTAEGVTRALAQGGIFGFPIAAAIAAAGAVQIGTILSASPGGGGGVRAPSASTPTVQNAPQRQTAEKSAPAPMVVYLQGVDRDRSYSGAMIEDLARELSKHSKNGQGLDIRIKKGA